MNTKRYVTFILSVAVVLTMLLSGCGPTSKAASLKPERVVENYFDWYLGYPGNALADGAYQYSEYLSEGFVQQIDEIIASFDQGGYDPFLCAQDIPGDLTVGEPIVSSDKATVVVYKTWNPGTEYASITEMTVTLQMTDGEWLIDDILCSLDAVPPAPESEPPQMATPEETARGFYEWYLDASAYDEQAGTWLSPLSDGRYQTSPYLTAGLVQKVDAIVAAFDQGGYDPFLCAQDVPESFTFEEAVVSGGIARLVVQTSFPGHGFTVALQRVDGLWKISDVLCEVEETQ